MIIEEITPFSQKTIGDKKLFSRLHGASYTVQPGANTLEFVVPYPTCKITEVELIGCVLGDSCSFKVLDSDAGIITTIPNYLLNQFGFDVQLPNNFYVKKSSYDADLVKDLKLVIEYNNSELSAKSIGINFNLHELK